MPPKGRKNLFGKENPAPKTGGQPKQNPKGVKNIKKGK